MTPSNATVPTPIIEPEVQARVEALAAVAEPRIEPSITEAEAIQEAHTDLWTGLMQELPYDNDPVKLHLAGGPKPRPAGLVWD